MSAIGFPLAETAETFGALPFTCMIPALQSSELRKHPEVRLNDLWQTERIGYRFPWSTEPEYPQAPPFRAE